MSSNYVSEWAKERADVIRVQYNSLPRKEQAQYFDAWSWYTTGEGSLTEEEAYYIRTMKEEITTNVKGDYNRLLNCIKPGCTNMTSSEIREILHGELWPIM